MNVLEQLVQVLREPQGEMARKQTLASPKLNTYLDTEMPGKGEVTFKAWRYEVKSLCASHEESVVKEAMIRSLREPNAMVLRGLPTNATVKEILRHMEQRCNPTIDVHVMLNEFNNMTQGSRKVQQPTLLDWRLLYTESALNTPMRLGKIEPKSC